MWIPKSLRNRLPRHPLLDMDVYSDMKIILASASPRRSEMFRREGFDALVIPSHADENLPFPMGPHTRAVFLSLKKALTVAEDPAAKKILYEDRSADTSCTLIVSADTIVATDRWPGSVMEKPENEKQAYDMLLALRGHHHHVITGVTLAVPQMGYIRCFYETTKVYFRDFSLDDLSSYVKTPEPYDKAGAYAIQGHCKKYVSRVEGDTDNVIGFPMDRFLSELEFIHDHR